MNETQIKRIALDMLRDNFLYGWTVKFGNNSRTIGYCHYPTQSLTFSRRYIGNETVDWQNVISHEVAHALVGHGHGHDAVWARQHRALGGDGKRCQEGARLAPDQYKWIIKCSQDRREIGRVNRKGKRLQRSGCKCHAAALLWGGLR